MSPEEFDALQKTRWVRVPKRIGPLQGTYDRTLLYGYDCDRRTWHVYQKDGHLHRAIYIQSNRHPEVHDRNCEAGCRDAGPQQAPLSRGLRYRVLHEAAGARHRPAIHNLRNAGGLARAPAICRKDFLMPKTLTPLQERIIARVLAEPAQTLYLREGHVNSTSNMIKKGLIDRHCYMMLQHGHLSPEVKSIFFGENDHVFAIQDIYDNCWIVFEDQEVIAKPRQGRER
jgi:hypothetical protein